MTGAVEAAEIARGAVIVVRTFATYCGKMSGWRSAIIIAIETPANDGATDRSNTTGVFQVNWNAGCLRKNVELTVGRSKYTLSGVDFCYPSCPVR